MYVYVDIYSGWSLGTTLKAVSKVFIPATSRLYTQRRLTYSDLESVLERISAVQLEVLVENWIRRRAHHAGLDFLLAELPQSHTCWAGMYINALTSLYAPIALCVTQLCLCSPSCSKHMHACSLIKAPQSECMQTSQRSCADIPKHECVNACMGARHVVVIRRACRLHLGPRDVAAQQEHILICHEFS